MRTYSLFFFSFSNFRYSSQFCCADNCGCNFGYQLWKRERDKQTISRVSGVCNFRVCVGIWKVVGPTGVASSERAIPIGDKVVCTECGGVCEHDLHSIGGTTISSFTLPSKVGHLRAVCIIDRHYGHCGVAIVARDKAGSH